MLQDTQCTRLQLQLLTIEVLDALNIIRVQLEVLDVTVHRVHQGLTHTGVV